MACKNCEAFQVAVRHMEFSLDVERNRAANLQRMLEYERAKPPVKELLETASKAAQIASLNEKSFPAGSPITDEASSVALAAGSPDRM